MIIALDRIETMVVRLPARADVRWLSLTRPLGEFVLARVSAQGIDGWGEVVALRDWGDLNGRRHGETPASVVTLIHDHFAPRLLSDEIALGRLTATLDGLAVGNPYAKALLDVALHDLVARVHGVPVHALLGGVCRDAVPVAHMLGLMPLERAAEEAEAAVADGVTALQVKGGEDAERDVRLVELLRGRLGDSITLRLDANGGYRGRVEVRRTLEALAAVGVDIVEQPVLGLDDLEEAHREAPVPLIADEACWTPSDVLELLRRRAVDAVSVYVGKAGGLAPARAMCAIAHAARLPHDLNGALELGIGNAANLHLAAASPAELLPSVLPINAPAGERSTATAGRYFEDDVIGEPFAFTEGAVRPPSGPGVGVEVDIEKVDRYCVERRVSTAEATVRS